MTEEKKPAKAAKPAKATKPAPDPDAYLHERVDVIFGDDADSFDVTPMVNDHAFQIVRGEKVSLPRYMLMHLDTCVTTVEKDGKTRDIKRFPYSIV